MTLKSIFVSKNFIAACAGAFMALAFAPINFPLALIISFPVFYFLLEKSETKKKSFWIGFSFGFGHFLAGIYWISISLLVDEDQFGWLIPLALTIIPGILATYIGLFSISYKFLINRFGINETCGRIILFALVWLIFEILRSNLLSGFPWNLIGYAWLFDVHFAQLASVFGIYGLSLLAVLTALFPVSIFQKKITRTDKIYIAAVAIFLCINLVFANFYIDDSKIITDSKSKLRLVQANIKQEIKWDEEQKYKDFFRQIELSDAKNSKDVKAIIWSETSVPYIIDDNPMLLMKLARAVPENGLLITGGLRLEQKKVWNSIFAINENGVSQHYDKHHLVPFGEFVPLHKFLSFLFLDSVVDQITGGGSGFSSGEGPKTLITDSFSFSPLVCYESIFSSEAVNTDHYPDLLLNLTNDAWFGNSSGPYQHFNMARMRAIEYGTPLIRVANTGISALVDPFGRVIKRINLNQQGAIDVKLMKNSSRTIYGNYRFLPLILLILALVFILTFFTTQKWKLEKSPPLTNTSPKN